jgi:hypothetical protein
LTWSGAIGIDRKGDARALSDRNVKVISACFDVRSLIRQVWMRQVSNLAEVIAQSEIHVEQVIVGRMSAHM